LVTCSISVSPGNVGLTDDEEAAAEIADEAQAEAAIVNLGYTPDADDSEDDGALSDTDENMNSMNSVVSEEDEIAPHIVSDASIGPAKAPRSILVNSPAHGTADLPAATGGTLSTTPTASGGTGATVALSSTVPVKLESGAPSGKN